MKRKFQVLTEAVEVLLERGEEPEDIVPVLLDAARMARAKQLSGLLVISGYGDPATAAAVSMALEEIHAQVAPPPSRIAFVAYLLGPFSAYHFGERYAQKFGIRAKVLVSVHDARNWLRAREVAGARAAAP